jgi:spermidine synthase
LENFGEVTEHPPLMMWIYTLFFISGIPALIYQIVWQRALFTIYGVNIESVTIVVGAFMLGLGLGSVCGGFISKKPNLPMLAVFGGIELCIGIFGAASLHIFHWAGTYTAGASLPATGALTFMLVLLPTTLMGATLPILVIHLVRISANVGSSVGMLYFVNTLGSATACLAAAGFLMRWLGESGCAVCAAGINFAVGTAALLSHVLTRNAASSPEPQPAPQAGLPDGRANRLFPFPIALCLVCLSGFIALSYELLWYRAYAFVSGTRASVFALLLGAYLEGVAFGSLYSKALCTRLSRSEHRTRVLAIVSGLLIVANGIGFLVVPILAYSMRWAPYMATFFLVALSAGLLGAVFPLLTHISIAPDSRAGAQLSRMYLANILGSALGTFLVGFVLMDHWSMQRISVFLLVLGLAMAAAIQTNLARKGRRLALLGGIAAVGFAGVLAAPAIFGTIYERMLFKNDYRPGTRFSHLLESRSGVVAVDDRNIVYGGGMYDGRFNTSLVSNANWIVRAYAISAFHPNPRRVLMIGLSSGSWAQVIANHSQVERFTIVEINPSYLELIRQYPEVAGVLRNPRVGIVIDDGRRWLARHPGEKFDLIVQNTTFHWRAHITNLLSVDYLRIIRKHLSPGGVFYYNTTDSDDVLHTGTAVFPYALRVMNFLAVSDSALAADKEAWRKALVSYRIEGKPVLNLELAPDRRTLADTLAMADTMEYGDAIRLRTRGKRIFTDDNMGAEWQ